MSEFIIICDNKLSEIKKILNVSSKLDRINYKVGLGLWMIYNYNLFSSLKQLWTWPSLFLRMLKGREWK